jgi:hypothetical protein
MRVLAHPRIYPLANGQAYPQIPSHFPLIYSFCYNVFNVPNEVHDEQLFFSLRR